MIRSGPPDCFGLIQGMSPSATALAERNRFDRTEAVVEAIKRGLVHIE